ncbi:MAG: hypothetical protein DWQ37_17260 [Planctomycetota bacterium]|nr:MAG: hypothetical protein DWQ37_17260 [Planctomycetota bacterium]
MDQQAQEKYRTRLLELRGRLIREVDEVEEAMREDVSVPGDRAGLSSHPADRAAEGMDENIAIAQNEEQMLEDVEAALERLEAGQFGDCQQCGRPIPKQRLDAIPYTPYCIECAKQQSG